MLFIEVSESLLQILRNRYEGEREKRKEVREEQLRSCLRDLKEEEAARQAFQ